MKIINMIDTLRNMLFKKLKWYRFLVPKIIVITYTGRCNARCIMCNIWNARTKSKDLSLDKYKQIFKESSLLKSASIINITGGELFLRKDIVEFVKFLVNNLRKLEEIRFATNGFLPKKIERDVKEIVKLKCNFNVKVSIDGLHNTHNKIRGRKDAFKLAQDTIQRLRKIKKQNRNFDVAVAHTIMPENIDEGKKVYDYFDKKGLDSIYKVIFHAKSFSNENVRLLNKEEKQKAIQTLKYVYERENQKLRNTSIGYKKLKKISYLLFTRFIINLLEGKKDLNFACHSTFSSITIESDGKVYSCGMIYLPFGDLKKEKFDDIWLNKKNRKKRDYINDGKCQCANACDGIPSLVIGNIPEVIRKFFFSK